MLTKIRLQRFKKFEEIEVIIKPFTVLMGENGSGKTTIIQAINCALNSLSTHKLVYTDPQRGPVVSKKVISLKALPGLNISDFKEVYYKKILKSGKSNSVSGATIDLEDEKGNNYGLQVFSLSEDFNIKILGAKTRVNKNAKLHNLPPLLISGFVGLQSLEGRAFPRAMQERIQTGRISEIIRNLILDTKEKKPTAFKRLKARLARDFDFYLNEMDFDEEKDANVRATFQDVSDDKKVSLDFNSSGSGLMQVLQILTPIYRFAPDETAIVLLDEPDAHLHPNLQYTLARTLREIQKELNVQIIISTHSTAIIRASDPSEVIPVSSKTKINAPLTNIQDVEDEIKDRINTYELAISKVSGKLVFMEDKNTSIFEAFDKILGNKCFYGRNAIPVIRGRSRDDKMPFQMKKFLNEWIKEDVEIHLIIDGDGMNSIWREKLSMYASKNQVILHQLSYHEIESYLLNPTLIFKSLKIKHPKRDIPDIEDIKEYIREKMLETITQNKYGFDHLLEDQIFKTATLLGDKEYREQHRAKSEAKKIRETYESYSNFEDLITVAMGKQTLKATLAWLNEEKKLNLSTKEILENLEPSDIPGEMVSILEQLRSDTADSLSNNISIKTSSNRLDTTDEMMIIQ